MSRRVRRTRAASSTADGIELSSWDYYDVQGDSRGALDALSAAAPSLTTRYNHALLKHVAEEAKVQDFSRIFDEFDNEAKALGKNDKEHPLRTLWILSYNRALLLHASGRTDKSLSICGPKIAPLVREKSKPSLELVAVSSQMAFLYLDCMLETTAGRTSITEQDSEEDMPSMIATIKWLEFLGSSDPHITFLLALFKSRVDLNQRDEEGKHVDANIRLARKELKTAMEVYQQKLRPPCGGETSSVVSSANSEENSLPTQEQQPPPPSSLVLQKYNQSALSLKANLEQLKGNAKKSLILCGEAQAAAKKDEMYDGIHYNNLALIYVTNDRPHLGLHTFSKAMKGIMQGGAPFHTDGNARFNASLAVLHNASVCALQARRFLSSYECMAACVVGSSIFHERPRCWIRMAEACIGLHVRNMKEAKVTSQTLTLDDDTACAILDSRTLPKHVVYDDETLVKDIGSRSDIEQVQRVPLLRAQGCLEYVLQLKAVDKTSLASARVSLAYVKLCMRDNGGALNAARAVIESVSVTDSVHMKRLLSTARMYAAEAACEMGNFSDAKAFLLHTGGTESLDLIASDLNDNTTANGASSNDLAEAQAAVRAFASVIAAAQGDPLGAKKFVSSTSTVDSPIESKQASIRRALMYSLMRDGHQSSALSLFLSLR